MRCKEEKSLDCFGPNPRSRDKKGYRCYSCHRIKNAATRAKRRVRWETENAYEVHLTGRKKCQQCLRTKSIHKFSRDKCAVDGLQRWCKLCQVDHWQLSNYGKIVKRTDCCDICGGKYRLGIDHCHQTGIVRGILCSYCNPGLGSFKDREDLLRLAIKYLKKHNTVNAAKTDKRAKISESLRLKSKHQ